MVYLVDILYPKRKALILFVDLKAQTNL